SIPVARTNWCSSRPSQSPAGSATSPAPSPGPSGMASTTVDPTFTVVLYNCCRYRFRTTIVASHNSQEILMVRALRLFHRRFHATDDDLVFDGGSSRHYDL